MAAMLTLLATASAFVAPRSRAPLTRVAAAPADAAETLFASQEASMSSLKSALNLLEKDYPASLGLASFAPATGGGGTLKSYEAPGDDNVAWASDLRVAGGDVTVSSLTVWCGPLKDVPHLVARTTVTADAVDVYVDFRPRAAVGYETALPDGSFPEPDSRDAFMARGKRDDLEKRFYGGLRDWRAGVAGAPKPAPASEIEALMRSPVAVDVSLPAGADSVATAAALCADAAKTFLAWTAEDHALKPGMQVTSTYARDTKLRSNNYGLLLDTYGALFGADGQNIAAGDAGPLDEAYVGGAS